MPYTLRWGILGAGGISSSFVKVGPRRSTVSTAYRLGVELTQTMLSGYLVRSFHVSDGVDSELRETDFDSVTSSRDVDDVSHKVTAVGSRDAKKAQEWIDKYITGDAHAEAKAYGSYEEVANASV